ncbi:hybrid sensor histidine kinase/response regulator [Desulfotignum phosphitoxidans]|uniref:histidine kinase n=1 Tax=Desulfotignum phosphitoxidans DSM 13687 TaxID=1286635 RepID=S0G236_9BACT|nr:chemotaxis protein CheW [Desulfotignum phosphitoxidans]EMS77766.1 signal transduction histidine kinase, chemotaxis protein CheA [Desulfotignum phosphitoxidans DSM 13687]
MNSKDDHIKKAFAEESLEHLASIEEDLIRIEKKDMGPDRERVNKVFRAVHSIKGGSGFLGIQNITRLAHAMETVLGLIREDTLDPNAEVIHFLLKASDALTHMIQYLDHSDKIDISDTVTALETISAGSRKNTDIPSRKPDPNPDAFADAALDSDPGIQPHTETPHDDDPIIISARDGSPVFVLEKSDCRRLENENKLVFFVEIPLETIDVSGEKYLETLSSKTKAYGTMLVYRIEKKYVPLAGTDGAGPYILMLFASVLAKEEILIVFELDDRLIHTLNPTSGLLPANTREDTPAEAPVPDTAMPETAKPDPDPGETDTCIEKKVPKGLQGHDRLIQPPVRVDLTLLDNLMTLAGEMVLSRNQLLQAIATRDPQAIQRVGQRINHVTSELQETVMLTRMQPMGKIFDRFPRLVRDLSTALGKKIHLVIKGRRVELDKNLLEAVTDPLLHLVRNSIDHGIEPPDIRENQGKDPVGKVVLKASQGAGKIFIEIIDDGRGMDPDKLAKRAVALGLITQNQVRNMDEKTKCALIFMPGFSTSQAVNDLSGRGVGMDVVKSNIESIGGKVTIESQPGLGSRFLIEVPLTLAIIPSQIIQTEAQRFAIPQANLEELVRIPPGRVAEKIEFISNAPVIRLREELLPLVRLSDILQLPRTYICPDDDVLKTDRRHHIADRRSSETQTESAENRDRRTMPGKDRRFHASSALNIAVVSTGSLTYGLIVDELQDAEEIVVKPLGRHLKSCGAYAGATIMGDGRVALILDISSLAETAELLPVKPSETSYEKTDLRVTEKKEVRSYLTFRGAPEERFAIPLDRVIHIEKIPARHLETMGHMTVVQTRNTPLPLCAIDDVADIGPVPMEEIMVVVVCDLGDRTMGLRVTGPVDALETSEILDSQTLSQPGISGSMTLDGHTVMVVDPDQVARKRYPQWYKDTPVQAASSDSVNKKTILIAEDSAFFRNLIKTRIEAEGFHVIAAQDGQIALDLIKTHVKDLSLVITDLEMPHMDGFTLTRTIKGDPELAHLPVISLSTLADDSDLEKGQAAGVDDYQIKLDQEKLLKSIHTHILDI